ncbi:MAG: stage 0 sporulation family protein [Clostridia bacterium]|nr:stage 0 sporulation family protein [Clostridia bacterium]
MVKITGVTFKEGGKVYYFAPGKEKYEEGMGVIVETSRGVEYATVVIPFAEVEDSAVVTPLKPIIRVATARDEETHRKNLEKKDGAMKTVREKIEKHNLDMKLIDCEFAFDGAKAVFYYSAPQRVDFRELVKDLSSVFRMRIELRQVGIRDEIKLLGGLAPCGRECCCSSCMPNINKVSIKMAKNQGLSLNPGKISGLCGRLMCCLSYENDYYADACKRVPKLGSEVGTPEGKGTVVNINMLKMQVRVKIEDKQKDTVSFKDFNVDELKFKAAKPCKGGKEEKDDENDPDLKEILD